MAAARAVKFCTKGDYIKFCQMDDKSPLKGAWLWSCDLFTFLVPYDISGMAKGRDFKLCTVVRQVVV